VAQAGGGLTEPHSQNQSITNNVIPAQAGIHAECAGRRRLRFDEVHVLWVPASAGMTLVLSPWYWRCGFGGAAGPQNKNGATQAPFLLIR
jgi:hypothetical protein